MTVNLDSDTHRPEIDNLRAISVLAIAAFHFIIFLKATKSGFTGVKIGFVVWSLPKLPELGN
jgi:peptidoglycan/LPS O-acetylase OafA/YrhL